MREPPFKSSRIHSYLYRTKPRHIAEHTKPSKKYSEPAVKRGNMNQYWSTSEAVLVQFATSTGHHHIPIYLGAPRDSEAYSAPLPRILYEKMGESEKEVPKPGFIFG